MVAEMPARVEAVGGAVVVDFPWSDAATGVEAFNAVAAELGTQLDARPDMVGTISDWEGTFRDDFDDAYERIAGTAGDLRETFMLLASAIVAGAEDANEAQRLNNEHAQESALAAEASSGQGG